MTTAIVTGATGMTGSAVVEALLKDNRYKQIYTLSRSQPSREPETDKLKHAHIDLQSSADTMAKDLQHIQSSKIHIFFCAYLARDSEAEASKVNSAMLQNFLDALQLTGALSNVNRIVLTCGLKHYGVHLGRAKQPMLETDAMLTDESIWPPNFYYTQQQILLNNTSTSTPSTTSQSKNPDSKIFTSPDTSKAKGKYTWTVTFPQDVLGYAHANFMNELTALALYASTARTAHKGSQLPFPGSRRNYMSFNCWTSATLHADFCLWAANAPNAENQVFNVVNGDTESWQNLWPKLAARFGCTLPEEMFPENGRGTWFGYKASGEQKLHSPAPVSTQAKDIGMKQDENEVSTLYQQIDTTAWSQDAKIKEAWGKLVKQHGLREDTWEKATWGFLTFVLGREFDCVVSMSKARKMGWTGYQDTWESMESVFQRLENEGVIPKVSDVKG